MAFMTKFGKTIIDWIKCYWAVLASAIGTIGLACLGIFGGKWCEAIACSYQKTPIGISPIPCDMFGDFTKLALNIKAPHPYFFLSIVIYIVGMIKLNSSEKVLSQLKISKIESGSARNKLYDELRVEKESHRETKESYMDDMSKYILCIIPLGGIGFDDNCRITIYRKITSDDKHLKEVFRYASQPRFRTGGRIKIPSNEGVVGFVWEAAEQTNFVANSDPSNLRAHNQDCKNHCKPSSYRPGAIPTGLRMPSLSYYARRLSSFDGRMAVLVLESMDKGRFDTAVCGEAFKVIISDLQRACSILCSLDSQFNPVDGEGA